MDPLLVTSGFVCAAAIAVLSYRLRHLTPGGAVAQFLLGWTLFGLGGFPWAVPILVFYVSSTALSRWSLRKRPALHEGFAKGATRDAAQVLANGGVAGICVTVWFVLNTDAAYVAGVSSMAAAAADTWGTELGIFSRSRPRLLAGWMETEPGASGGVTWFGTAAAAGGALLVAAGALMWLASPGQFGAVVLGGLSGALVDSLLGATLQSMRRCRVCGRLTERGVHCGQPALHARGLGWMSNDMVNLFCTVAGALAGSLLSVIV